MKVELDENIPESEVHFKDRDGNVIFKMINMGIHMNNFIKMCDHPLIQDAWEPKVGDWTDEGVVATLKTDSALTFRIYNQSGFWTEHYVDHNEGIHADAPRVIWLPTIEQLMGMIPDKCEFELGRDRLKKETVKAFFVVVDDGFPLFSGNIPQEALIQAVMHELHNKKWTGTEWS